MVLLFLTMICEFNEKSNKKAQFVWEMVGVLSLKWSTVDKILNKLQLPKVSLV